MALKARDDYLNNFDGDLNHKVLQWSLGEIMDHELMLSFYQIVEEKSDDQFATMVFNLVKAAFSREVTSD